MYQYVMWMGGLLIKVTKGRLIVSFVSLGSDIKISDSYLRPVFRTLPITDNAARSLHICSYMGHAL
jgi:hypothetical protein